MLKHLSLQLLAGETGGTAGADGAAAETGAADLSSRLAEMGVPRERLERRKAALDRKAQPVAQEAAPAEPEAEPSEEPAQEASEAPAAEAPENEQPKRLTWDEIKADPEYNQEIQKIVQNRLKASKGAEELAQKLQPALDVLGGYYGQDPGKLDVDALVRSIVDDDAYYEDRAVAEGKSVEDVRAAVAKARQDRDLEEQTRRQRFDNAWRQGEQLKQTIPDFDMSRELENPSFRAMVMGFGMPVEDAWYAVHHREREQQLRDQITKQASEDAAKIVQAGQKRPAENGSVPQGASVTQFNVRDPAYRAQIRAQVAAAAARGEKVYPPHF